MARVVLSFFRVLPRRPAPHIAQAGFTLIEMLVALAVLSLAALALVRLQGVSIRTTADLDAKLVGQIVARNLMIEALTDPTPPSLGTAKGVVENGGQPWRWTRKAEVTADARILRVDLTVEGPQGVSPNVLTFVRTAE